MPQRQASWDIAKQPQLLSANGKTAFWAMASMGLFDMPRCSQTASNTKQDEQRIIDRISQDSPDGSFRSTLDRNLGYSDDFAWRFVRKNNLHLNRSRSWCVSTDPKFATKAADIVGFYLTPPEDAIVIGIDASRQALSRTVGYVKTQDSATMRAYKSTYRLNSSLLLRL